MNSPTAYKIQALREGLERGHAGLHLRGDPNRFTVTSLTSVGDFAMVFVTDIGIQVTIDPNDIVAVSTHYNPLAPA